MDILHLERQILVWNKPAGIETQDERAHYALCQEINKREDRTGTPFLHPIHRLDQPTSGIVVFARSSKALSRLQESLRERNVKKTYLAWVEGTLQGEGKLSDTLKHASHQAIVDSEGKSSHLYFKVLENQNKRTLLLIQLMTGRYHQIRLQFSSRGHPIIGDTKYGARPAPRLLLHHYAFTIPHPITSAALSFKAPPGAEFPCPLTIEKSYSSLN
jgi:23S rRNA pseudouridine1911/1915/1917 synthase